ncbi:MAG: COG1361 S-layer family protein, partial [Candidatus Hadarchaeota archaeon]
MFSILILSFLAAGVSGQPIITVDHHTVPENPGTGDFILSVDLQNAGGNAKNVKLFLYEKEDDLSILSGGKEVSSIILSLGDLATGSSSAQLKMRAEKAGIYEIKARIDYDYGEYLYKASINRVIALKVIDEPQFSVSKELTIAPSGTEDYSIKVLNGGGRAKDVSISMSTPEKIVSNLGKVVFDSWESNKQKELAFSLTADESVSTGVYELDLHMSYSNEFGEPHSETISIPLRVKGTPQLIISE